MYKFSRISESRLSTCDERLQLILRKAIQIYDFSVLEGYRDEATQNKYFAEGKSKLKYPNGKHNSNPSKAVDIAPFPIDWADRERFFLLAGLIIAIGAENGIKIRWGGAWSGLAALKSNKFDDLVHFEIID
jgi:peptidoglycan L-alanyl-D-glutamate endopeptidase CwlK